MLIVKSFLISVLIMEGLYCSVVDVRTGKIPNTAVLCGLLCALVGNIAYFIISNNGFLVEFMLNIFFAAILSFVMYGLRIWAGGDVKLFILFSMLLPVDFLKQKAPLSIVAIYIITFSFAFMYLIIESAVLLIKKEKRTKSGYLKISAKSVFPCTVSIMTLQTILRLVFQKYYYEYIALFLLLNVIFVLVFNKIKLLNHKISIVVCTLISGISIVFSVSNGQYSADIKSILVMIIVICFRTIAERFNYREINTTDVKKGMILSYGTVIGFANSRVKGLPQFTTEDLSTRITQEEADSIVRWASSKNGKDKIIILRKIPFAAFITSGFIIYLFLGVFVW